MMMVCTLLMARMGKIYVVAIELGERHSYCDNIIFIIH